MRTLILSTVVLSVSIVSTPLVAAPADEPAMSCVERLEMPQYPGVARRARLRGDVSVTAVLNPDGSIKTVQFAADTAKPSLPEFFRAEIETALRRSKFSSACAAHAITLVFEFRLVRDKVPDSFRGGAFTYPNRFEIAASEPIAQP
jgi:hypothetical protein